MAPTWAWLRLLLPGREGGALYSFKKKKQSVAFPGGSVSTLGRHFFLGPPPFLKIYPRGQPSHPPKINRNPKLSTGKAGKGHWPMEYPSGWQ